MIKIVPLSLLVAISILCFLPSCFSTQEKQSGLLVVNVLSESLYDDCHIKDSINVPFEKLDTFIDTLSKDAQVVFYCSNYMCTSSMYAAKKLKEKSFAHVWAYEGGTAEWYQKGLPVEGPCKQSYLQKKLEPSESDTSGLCITVQQLAQKMGLSTDI